MEGDAEMREILFRGKDPKGGLWYEGDLSFDRDGQPFIRWWKGDIYSVIAVFPESVGQFTGFYDRNGRKIFEGDILKSTYRDEPFEPAVSYEEVFWRNGWYQAHFGDRSISDDLMQSCLDEYSEVAGNVWDYPGLLGVKK
jgi:hypothetical protein